MGNLPLRLESRPEPAGELLARPWTADKPAGALRVVTYNILAPVFASSHAYVGPELIEWQVRKWTLLRELEAAAADVLLLQEVEPVAFEFLQFHLRARFHGEHLLKTADERLRAEPGPDGVAVFFARDRLALAGRLDVRLADEAAALAGDRGLRQEAAKTPHEFFWWRKAMSMRHVALALRLRVLGAEGEHGGQELVVCSTHLHWSPADPEVKALQAWQMCEAVERFAAGRPVVLAGDTNSLPFKGADEADEFDAAETLPLVSGAYALLRDGQLPVEHPHHPAARAGVELPAFRHGLALRSAYLEAQGAEPHATNWTQGFKGTLDYVFCRGVAPVAAVAAVPPAEALGEALPSAVAGSDHVWLGADVVLEG